MNTEGFGIEGALAGYTEYVADAIESHDPPAWIDVDREDLARQMRVATERAQQNRDLWREQTEVGGEPDRQFYATLTFGIDLDDAPTEVRARLEEWVESHRECIASRRSEDVEFDEFGLSVQLTPEGDVADLTACAWFAARQPA